MGGGCASKSSACQLRDLVNRLCQAMAVLEFLKEGGQMGKYQLLPPSLSPLWPREKGKEIFKYR